MKTRIWSIGLILGILSISIAVLGCSSKKMTDHKTYTYLALGDSYTIGEGVEAHDRYPSQAIRLLGERGLFFDPALIIAQTGWTTDELGAGISQVELSGRTFDLVTLLIGVNNQYRGRDIDNYAEEFKQLLTQAIAYANDDPSKVIVLSIPDWGVTPFAEEKGVDRRKTSEEIDAFNDIKKRISEAGQTHFIDITEAYRANGAEQQMLVEDKLHPSGQMYASWAEKITELVARRIYPQP